MNQITPFVGREKEIALFKQCFEAILPENAGKPEYANLPKILSFYGASGVGKTALKNKLLEVAQEMCPEVVLLNFFCAERTRIEFSDGTCDDIAVRTLEIIQNKEKLDIFRDDIDIVTKQRGKNIYYAVQNMQKNDFQHDFEIEEHSSTITLCVFEDLGEEWISYTDFLNNQSVLFLCFNTFNLFQDANYETISIDSINESFLYQVEDFEGNKYPITQKFAEICLTYFNFEESKALLNGFFSQFEDKYIKKIYQYTQGNPKNLRYLVDLVKNNRLSAEVIITQLIDNQGETLTKLQLADKTNENLTEKIISVMTHNLNNKFAGLLLDFDYLKNKLVNIAKDEALEEVLASFYKGLRESADMFSLTERYLQKQQPNLLETNLLQFLENEVKPLAQNKHYTIEVISEETTIHLPLDREAFKEAMRNLLGNAEKHGFVQAGKAHKVVFVCSLVQENEQDFVKILYKNNGKAFPQGFDFDSYILLSYASGKTKGSGIGGFWINKVVKLHKGKFRAVALHNTQAEFPVILEILLPIS